MFGALPSVLDARHINPHVVKFKHKYEDAKTARQLYDQGDFVFSYDLKSAYHHISIFETDTTYLGFKWEHEYYVYNVLPFRLSTSGYIFTKVVREVIKYWRSAGIKLDNTVKETVQDRGIEVGSYMYELYPKMCELLINSKRHTSLPAQPVHVALYLTHLLNNYNSTCHPVSNAVYGIKWAHEINGLNDPTSNSFVTSILEASKRVATKKTEKEDPISPETLIELCDMFKNSLDLLVIRDLAVMILSFSGFLRYDEVSSLRFCDVKVHESHLILCIEKSKTDQYRQSSEVLISKSNSSACPNTMFLRFDPPIRVNPGDEIRTTCTYSSLSSNETIFFGEGTSDEMCYGFITYYPAQNIALPYCTTWKTVEKCKRYMPQFGAIIDGCRWKDFLSGGNEYIEFMMIELAMHCNTSCFLNCTEKVRNLRNTNAYE
ncbi:Hypothetical predicted protein, partial [Mytilus galloprovincialis]